MIKLNSEKLKIQCLPISFDRPTDNLRLAQDLFQLMIKERGIGLAANQAGYDLRLFVMYVEKEAFHCFNPEIIGHSENIILSTEGCLSFPGESCLVPRYESIVAKFANARGSYQEREFTGLAARCFQHELDHLDAITMHEKSTINV